MMDIKKILIGAIITTVVGSGIAEIWTTYKPISAIISFLKGPVVLEWWGVILMVIVLPLIGVGISTINIDPDYYKYTTDNIRGIKWKWQWSNGEPYCLLRT